MSDDLSQELRAFEGSEALANGDFSVCIRATDRIEAQAARIAELEAALVTAKREGMKEAARIIQKVWDTSTQDDPDEWIDAYPDPASYPAVTTYIAAINDALPGGEDE